METGDRVKLKKVGLIGTIEETIIDHVTGTNFYVVQFDNGDFDTYTEVELIKVK